MQTLTLQANNAFLEQGQDLIISDGYFEQRYEKDLQAYERGELKTISFEEFEKEVAKWQESLAIKS